MGIRTTTRWVEDGENPDLLRADLLTAPIALVADRAAGLVRLGDSDLAPDTARMLGVWLLEAATHAEGERATRRAPVSG